jgi:hypothetical protein
MLKIFICPASNPGMKVPSTCSTIHCYLLKNFLIPLVSKSLRIIAPSIIAIGNLQKSWYVFGLPFSVRVGCEYGLAVFPVIWIPTRLMPVNDRNNPTGIVCRHYDVAWMQVCMSKGNWRVVRK